MPEPLHIVCLSNLAWERRLFQRPQQLMTRFAAAGDRVLYVARWSSRRWLRAPADERTVPFAPTGLARNIPYFPLSGRVGFMNGLSIRLAVAHARRFLRAAPAGRRVLWFQNPDYEEAARALDHDLLVFDCMDPFVAFEATAPWVAEKDRRVVARADLLFTGGRSLQRQREGTHQAVHCFPSGIDFDHFARGAQPGELPADLAPLPRPVLGYFGAVDERIDWDLIGALCRARPQWSVVFLGPLIGLPAAPIAEPNFHHLGPKAYDLLPDYLRGFDVALIPWKVNELTRFMSPTKTPEYLAAGRPVVSTPIPDVEADYGDEVHIAADASGFVAACDRALADGTGPARKPPQSQTWDEIAQAMKDFMEQALERKG
ncbi:MAG: glycosyltransferase [Candidatus Sumerlaeia bacterium]|nr:glycosyltransferase [Candidatus Sumerlaeia bacterium]